MKIIASLMIMIATAALLFAWLAIPRYTVAQTGDYDADDDGLIEIRALEQLNAVRWDLDGDGEVDDQANRDAYAAAFPNALTGMGCPDSGCDGYELARDLDFDDAGSYASGAVNAKWTGGAGWLPIGLTSDPFRTTFDGNDHTIANLYINRSGLTDPGAVGLFGRAAFRATVRQVGTIDVDVTGVENVGGLLGQNGGTVSDSYATGSVSGNRYVGGLAGLGAMYGSGTISGSHSTVTVSGNDKVGGLTGYMFYGTIIGSYATGSVSGSQYVGGLIGGNSGTSHKTIASYAVGSVSGDWKVGGLVGENRGESLVLASYATGDVSGNHAVGGLVGDNHGVISACYAMGSVSGNDSLDSVVIGGLVGENRSESSILASYVIGDVSGSRLIGGVIGRNQNNAIVSDSYWDTQTSGKSSGMGEGASGGVMGKTTAELQSPTGYTGIYAGWLLDFDNADSDFDDTTGVDDFWDFGTSSEYPALKADFDGDGVATWQEFGDQRGQSPTPPPTSTTTPAMPTPVLQADMELTMLRVNALGFLWYYLIVENNGPSDATGVVLTDSFPEGVSPILSIPVAGTCAGDKRTVCELDDLAVGSRNLVMIIARLDDALSQSVTVNTASVSSAERDPYPTNNQASR